jgi:hypothetical protein
MAFLILGGFCNPNLPHYILPFLPINYFKKGTHLGVPFYFSGVPLFNFQNNEQ